MQNRISHPEALPPDRSRGIFMPVEIPLVNGGVALIDAEDLPLVSGRNWRLNLTKDGNPSGVVSGTKDSIVLMHRLITGADENSLVDHKDGNPLNNVRSNLRQCTHSQNMRNRRRHKNNRSGFKGVYANRRGGRIRSWTAEIKVDGKKYRLGTHKTPELAYAAYKRAAKWMHGEFARFD